MKGVSLCDDPPSYHLTAFSISSSELVSILDLPTLLMLLCVCWRAQSGQKIS